MSGGEVLRGVLLLSCINQPTAGFLNIHAESQITAYKGLFEGCDAIQSNIAKKLFAGVVHSS
jgi:hypothetical protein